MRVWLAWGGDDFSDPATADIVVASPLPLQARGPFFVVLIVCIFGEPFFCETLFVFDCNFGLPKNKSLPPKQAWTKIALPEQNWNRSEVRCLFV